MAVATGGRLGHALFVFSSEEFPCRRYHLLPHGLEISLNQRASRAGMPAPAELLRELVDIDVASAAKRDLHLVVAEVTEEDRQPRTADRAWMLGDSFQIFGPQTILLRSASSDRDPGYSVFRIDLQGRQRIPQEMQTTNGHRRVEPAIHLFRLDAGC